MSDHGFTPDPPRPDKRPLWPPFRVKAKPADNATPAGQLVPVVPARPTAPVHRALVLWVLTAFFGGAIFGVIADGAARYAWHQVQPGPGPRPEPTPKGELRVILVSDDGSNLTRGQLNALNSTAVRGWLNSHCAKDAEGRAAWRSWSPDIDVSNEPSDWRKAWEEAKPHLGSPPVVVLFHGEKYKVFPLPDSEDGLLDLLKKHGG